ncbi:MAG TPA: methyltransferase domain-containing protein [Anaerolineales bacterium]|nr:methyltransferase domain-containing protein [Anaerolineales bacterium]
MDPLQLSPHEQAVDRYYDLSTEGFFLRGWDPEHLHWGVFEQAPLQAYEADPSLAFSHRHTAVRRMTEIVVGSARIRSNDLVVDAGCGVGGTAMFAASEFGCSVIGLNLNRKQLDIARTRAEAHGLAEKVSFQRWDCSQGLPFDDESVDVILNIESACHYSDRRGFIADCARVLRPEGRLAATDLMRVDNLSATDMERHIRPLEAAWFLFDIESLSSYRRLLAGAGLQVIEAEPIDRLLPNAYILRALYQEMQRPEVQSTLAPFQRANQERLWTCSEAVIQGKATVGRYLASKKASIGI